MLSIKTVRSSEKYGDGYGCKVAVIPGLSSYCSFVFLCSTLKQRTTKLNLNESKKRVNIHAADSLAS